MDLLDRSHVIWATWLSGNHRLKGNIITKNIPLRANIDHPNPFKHIARSLIPIF
jgi:hypothetical protein